MKSHRFQVTRQFGLFRSLGLPEEPAWFPFGSDATFSLMTGKVPFVHVPDQVYNRHRGERMVGYHAFDQPTLVLNDLELVKQVRSDLFSFEENKFSFG